MSSNVMIRHKVNCCSDLTMAISSSVLQCITFLMVVYSSLAFEPVDVRVDFNDQTSSPEFRILLSGVEWFRSGVVSIRNGGETWTTNNKENCLKPVDKNTETGEDILGEFNISTLIWQAFSDDNTPTNVKIETSVRVYRNKPIVYFTVDYISGLTNASIHGVSTQTLSSYPSLIVEDRNMKKGYVTWSKGQLSNTMVGELTSQTPVYGDLDGGFPLVVFNEAMDTAVVLSPATSFMSAMVYSFKDDQTGDMSITFGPMSSINEVPADYQYSTILVASNNVTGAMKEFGEVMRTLYSKTLDIRNTDFSLNYLGYWTDNGACYYHSTGSQYSNYEEVFVAVKNDADQKGIPYRYVQIDDWWYYQDAGPRPGGGTTSWTAIPALFPHGIQSVVNQTGWRVFAHNKVWSANNIYQTNFKFINDSVSHASLPIDSKFWDYLFSTSQKNWELFVYEQDSLDLQFQMIEALKTQLDLGEVWLKQMGDAAQRYGITIQYCMTWARHVMQSVAIPAVTQVRVSGDYMPNDNQWYIGDSSIFAHAMGLAPSKDDFRTSSNQPDCHNYTGGNIESAPAIEAYAAVLSGGPVGPSDQVGMANVTLTMATCMMDGRLLQPTRPALSLDSTFTQRAFGSGGPDGRIVAAYTEIDHFTWYYLFSGDLSSSYVLTAKELPPSQYTFPASSLSGPTIAFQYTLDGTVTKITEFGTEDDFGPDTKLNISQCGKSDFQYWVIPPNMTSSGVTLLGELNKIIPVSAARFSDIILSGSDVMVKVNGVPSERVTVTLYNRSTSSNKIGAVDCTISASGINWLSLSNGECHGA